MTGEQIAIQGVHPGDVYEMAEKKIQAFVIGCGDPRFRRLFEKEIFKKTHIPYAYVWPNWIPGGVRRLNLASGEELHFTFEEICIAVELAHAAGIPYDEFVFVFANHAGVCAGYRGEDARMDTAEQVLFHRQQLLEAERLIVSMYESRYGVKPKVLKIVAVPEIGNSARGYWID